jgi:hypothetical protein
MDGRRQQREHTLIPIDRTAMEKVKLKFLGVHITDDQMVHPHVSSTLGG